MKACLLLLALSGCMPWAYADSSGECGLCFDSRGHKVNCDELSSKEVVKVRYCAEVLAVYRRLR